MSAELVNLLVSRFIARRDVRAVQLSDQGYMPDGVRDRETKQYTSYFPWDRDALERHLSGDKSYGHYLLDHDDTCKLFAFDVDLEKTGFLPTIPMDPDNIPAWESSFAEANPREAWRDRANPARDWMKLQFRQIAHMLVKGIETELGLPVAAAYSGNKGIHVYGFTGRVPAADAREAAMIVVDSLGVLEASRGVNFFRFKDQHPVNGYPNLSIEVFPKQDTLAGKEGFGNLMRLPLGRNRKTPDPTFFIDMTSPMNVLQPVDPVHALTTSNPWKRPGE